MNKVLFVAIVFAVGVAAVSAEVEAEHDAAINELAQQMPEHAAAFAEVSAAAGTDDVFAVLDSISSNIRAERKHASVFYKSYRKTTTRDLRKYKLLIAKLGGNERRAKATTAAERHEIKQTRRAVNANVRSLSRAVGRFQHIQSEERRTTHKKKSAMRHLNNKIADRKVYLRVLKLIRAALERNDKPNSAKFIEALSVASAHGLTASNGQPTVFLAESESIEQTTDTSAENEADASIDAEAFENVEVSDSELELEEAEADEEAEEESEEEEEEEAEDEASDEALDAAEEATSDEEAIDEADSEEESDEEVESEAEAEAETESEEESDGSEARMMQVLSQLASGSQSDDSIQELLRLVDSLIADVRASIAAAKKRKVAVLARFTQQMQNLQQLANSIKATIRRLQATVQTGKARLAALQQTNTSVAANTKETDAQLKSYRAMYKGLKANWAKYDARYQRNQAKRTRQLEQLDELKRRLSAVERNGGSLNVDLSKVQLRYRWKAYPFGACGASCGPSTRTRSVKCLSFSGQPVKHSFCAGQKKPKRSVKCQKKLCPVSCVVSDWKKRGKCSNQCGTGVRLHTRSIVEPARFGGKCPQQFKLTKHKPCKSMKGCAAGQQPTAQAAKGSKSKVVLPAEGAMTGPQTETERAAARKAKNLRCISRLCTTYNGSKAPRICRAKNCLSKSQRERCKACPRGLDGKKDKACRRAECSKPARARQNKIRKALAAKKAAKKAARRASRGGKKGGKRFKKAIAKAKAAAKAARKRSAKKFKKCMNRCRRGRKGKKCRRSCKAKRDARHSRIQSRKQKAIAAVKARRAQAKAAKAGAVAPGAVTADAEAARRERNLRCISKKCSTFKGSKEGRKCRFNHCLNAAQQAQCKACPRDDATGKKDKTCRREKCTKLAKARQQKIRKARNDRCVSTLCTTFDGKKLGRKCRFHNCLTRKQQKACKKCPRNKRGEKKRKCRRAKCSKPAKARQAHIRKVRKAKRAAERKAKKAAARKARAAALAKTAAPAGTVGVPTPKPPTAQPPVDDSMSPEVSIARFQA